MITIKKIKTLSPRTRVRKLASIFYLSSKEKIDTSYLEEAFSLLINDEMFSKEDKDALSYFFNKGEKENMKDIYYRVLSVLGETPSDWDNIDNSGNIDWNKRKVKKHTLFLDRIRSPFNVGSIFRSSESFCVDKIILSLGTASPEHKRAEKTSRGTTKGVEWEYDEVKNLKGNIFALECGGEDISTFSFPKNGVCIIGGEEDGISKESRKMAEESCGIVTIPLYGAKGSINVSSAVSILLYEWARREKENV